MILDYHKICPPTVTIMILKHYKRLSVSIFNYNTMQKTPNFLESLFTISQSSCATVPRDPPLSPGDGPLTVWDLEDDSWIRFLKLLSEGHPDPLPDPDPEIWNIDIKRMCAEIKINGIIWIFFRLFPMPITNNHHPSSSINFVMHLLKLGVEGGLLEMASILNANDVDDNTPNTTISLNTFQPPISNIHHIPLTIGNMSYVQRTIWIACAISITMFFSWNL